MNRIEGVNGMINYAHERAIRIMENTNTVIVATAGPSGLQIGEFSCEVIHLVIYILIPIISDHLFNLEHDGHIALHTDRWELAGQGEILSDERKWPVISLISANRAMWHVPVKVTPKQLQVLRPGKWGPQETIDFTTFA